MRVWTRDEDAFLRKNRGLMTSEQIGEALGRTANSVIQHAFHLKLPRLPRWHSGSEAKGNKIRNGKRGISVVFDEETWDQVKRVAKADGLPFNGAVLQLVEWGLMERESNL